MYVEGREVQAPLYTPWWVTIRGNTPRGGLGVRWHVSASPTAGHGVHATVYSVVGRHPLQYATRRVGAIDGKFSRRRRHDGTLAYVQWVGPVNPLSTAFMFRDPTTWSWNYCRDESVVAVVKGKHPHVSGKYEFVGTTVVVASRFCRAEKGYQEGPTAVSGKQM